MPAPVTFADVESSRLADRLRGLPRAHALGLEVPVAVGLRARLLGLSRLPRELAGDGLLIPRCSSVHTFGMRFALDLVFLDRGGRPLAIYRGIPPRRLVWRRGAAAVLETPAAEGGEFVSPDPWVGDAAAETRDCERRRL